MMNILGNVDNERIFFRHDVIFIFRGFCCDNRLFDKHNETIVIVTIVYNVYIYLYVQNILQIELIDLNLFLHIHDIPLSILLSIHFSIHRHYSY